MKRGWLHACLILSAMALGVSIYLYTQRDSIFPEQVPTHWDLHGKPDQWTARAEMFWYLMIMPLAMFGMTLLAQVLPWLSPQHFKVDAKAKVYSYVMFLVIALFAYLHGVILLSYAEPDGGDFLRFFLGGMFLFFTLMGNVLGQVPRNFWMGVRTPWTLASNLVWVKTHRLAAWTFVSGGLLGMLLVWLNASPYLYIAVVAAAAGIPVVYSLVLYKKLEKRGELTAEPMV